VHVHSGGRPGPYVNQVIATGDSPATVTVTDSSQDGDDSDPDGDGDAGDDNDPTVVTLLVSVVLIPTLDEWGLMTLVALLALVAARRLRRTAA
jgi:hypothetical protein